MSYYVRVPRLNGRYDHAALGIWLLQSGVIEVEYYDGGWADRHVNNIAPHLKFEHEQDATAYVLANGGLCSKEIPEMVPGVDYYPGG
jgi:hypothetical protein